MNLKLYMSKQNFSASGPVRTSVTTQDYEFLYDPDQQSKSSTDYEVEIVDDS